MIATLLLATASPQTADRPPCGPPPHGSRAWVTPSDYPAEARREHMRGNTVVELQVSTQGCPVACRIVKSSGYALLDDKSCALLMERARFRFTPEELARAKEPVTVQKTVMWAEP